MRITKKDIFDIYGVQVRPSRTQNGSVGPKIRAQLKFLTSSKLLIQNGSVIFVKFIYIPGTKLGPGKIQNDPVGPKIRT